VIYLLDVNVLIALFDSQHVNHTAAHRWFTNVENWATCPVTENAFVRILTNPSYPTIDARPAEVIEALVTFSRRPKHHFFDDDITVRDGHLFDGKMIAGTKQITDIYLVGLAHRHRAKLATFDRKLSHRAIIGAKKSTLFLINA